MSDPMKAKASRKRKETFSGNKKKSAKGTKSYPVETPQAAIQLCAFNMFVEEFMRPLGDAGYKALEEEDPGTCEELQPLILNAEEELSTHPHLMDKIVSALIESDDAEADPVDLPRVGGVDETGEHKDGGAERRMANALLREEILSQRDVLEEMSAGHEYDKLKRLQEELRQVIEVNNRNRREIRNKRGTLFEWFEFQGILKMIDSRVEGLYSRRYRAKKKKKDEDSHFIELEALLEKREKLLELGRHLPKDVLSLKMEPLDLRVPEVSREFLEDIHIPEYFPTDPPS
jgi:Histone acetyltransferases subunit 3